jgi:hypothetical protein
MPTPTAAAPHPPLHADLRRFARQVQAGFALTLLVSIAMLVLHG